MIIAAVIVVLIIGSVLMAGGLKYKKVTPFPGAIPYSQDDILTPPASQSKKNLQLDTFKFCTRAQGDDGVCYAQNSGICCPNQAWAKVLCENKKCVGVVDDAPGKYVKGLAEKAGMNVCDWLEHPSGDPGNHPSMPISEWCSACNATPGFMCWGKPVILLYPEKPTLVNVEVKTLGEIYVSDPLYPAGGWKEVLANPNGSLVYQNKKYNELFYESKVKNYGMPENGYVYKTSELDNKIPELLYNLGLNNTKSEIPEFMDFWLPKLNSLNSPYIFVSLIEKEIKEKNDKVVIKPEPDTRIELIVYFKPLEYPLQVKPLTIPTRPERRGFTEVEWGGTIDLD